jgi:predicted RNA binding protein YcfA (HicA-like mRNA interferase family)
MSKLPVISGAECVNALEQIGFVVARQRGSHIILVQRGTNNSPLKKRFKSLL